MSQICAKSNFQLVPTVGRYLGKATRDISEREKRILFINARTVLKPGTSAPCRLIILNNYTDICITDAGMTRF